MLAQLFGLAVALGFALGADKFFELLGRALWWEHTTTISAQWHLEDIDMNEWRKAYMESTRW